MWRREWDLSWKRYFILALFHIRYPGHDCIICSGVSVYGIGVFQGRNISRAGRGIWGGTGCWKARGDAVRLRSRRKRKTFLPTNVDIVTWERGVVEFIGIRGFEGVSVHKPLVIQPVFVLPFPIHVLLAGYSVNASVSVKVRCMKLIIAFHPSHHIV